MRKSLLAFVMLLNVCLLKAEVRFPSVIGDNMVLQQNKKVCLWGTAKANSKLTVIPSWNSKKYQTHSDSDGHWTIEIETTHAGGPYSITFNDGQTTTLENILLGEVWICSGQSNMEMPLKGFSGQPVKNSLHDIVESQQYPQIRMYTAKQTPALSPQSDVVGSWEQSSITHAPQFSAVGYYYAKALHQALHVPIGMIHVSWGGASIESWMGKETLRMYPEINLDAVTLNTPLPQQTPTLLYNGMLRPVSNFTVRGFIWYQGETNIPNYKKYVSLFPTMVNEWRKLFKGGEKMPFYYVQIAPYQYGGNDKAESAFLRESQLRCASIIPNSGMAVTMDKGEEKCIHPAEKEIVGERLAYQALAKTYQFKNLPCDGPVFQSLKKENNKLLLTFDHAEMGLYPMYVELPGFEVAGEDGTFYPAKAIVNQYGPTLELSSDQIKTPVYVRYGFKNFLQGSLFNGNGLPASSFRTDDF